MSAVAVVCDKCGRGDCVWYTGDLRATPRRAYYMAVINTKGRGATVTPLFSTWAAAVDDAFKWSASAYTLNGIPNSREMFEAALLKRYAQGAACPGGFAITEPQADRVMLSTSVYVMHGYHYSDDFCGLNHGEITVYKMATPD